ncbi:hypothetical protein GCM10027566_38120 [Arachidicoccus ginsenosidivorans]
MADESNYLSIVVIMLLTLSKSDDKDPVNINNTLFKRTVLSSNTITLHLLHNNPDQDA